MLPEKGYETAYRGSKDFSQLEVPTANATGFGAAARDPSSDDGGFRMSSEAMQEAGIFPGDVLIVDRSIPARHGKVIIAVVNGEMMVRRLMQQRGKTWLTADNKNIPPLNVDAEHELTVWGVVVYAIHTV